MIEDNIEGSLDNKNEEEKQKPKDNDYRKLIKKEKATLSDKEIKLIKSMLNDAKVIVDYCILKRTGNNLEVASEILSNVLKKLK